jgi:hypothetical protein
VTSPSATEPDPVPGAANPKHVKSAAALEAAKPLAERVRPQTLDQIVGQWSYDDGSPQHPGQARPESHRLGADYYTDRQENSLSVYFPRGSTGHSLG